MTAPFVGPRRPYLGVCKRCDAQVVRWKSDGITDRCDTCRGRDMVAAFAARNPGRQAANSKRWSSENRERTAEIKRRWLEANPEKRKAVSMDYFRRNRDAFNARRSRRNLAVPQWADKKAIRAVYREAARLTIETGIIHEVDHIIPVCGKTVTGLHVAENLQAIPRKVNRTKWAHFDPAVH